MATRPTIFWFRNDLRLDDHTPLTHSLAGGAFVPLFVFDPRQFATTPDASPDGGGTPSTGRVEAQAVYRKHGSRRRPQRRRAVGG